MSAANDFTLLEAASKDLTFTIKTWLEPLLQQLPRVVRKVLQNTHVGVALAEMMMPAEVRHVLADLEAWFTITNSSPDPDKLPQPALGNPRQMFSNAWPRGHIFSDVQQAYERPFPDEVNVVMEEFSKTSTMKSPHAEDTVVPITSQWFQDTVNGCSNQIEVTEPITTLMMCDLPCRLTINEVVNVIILQGFSDTFDLVYMPQPTGLRGAGKNKRGNNLGYAFVNFKTPEDALEFTNAFSNFSFPGGYSTKLTYSKPARCQGYAANWRNWKQHYQHEVSDCVLQIF